MVQYVVEKDWITVKQFADRFGYHVEYVRQMIREGKLEAVKARGWRISPSAIEAFFSSRTTTGSVDSGGR